VVYAPFPISVIESWNGDARQDCAVFEISLILESPVEGDSHLLIAQVMLNTCSCSPSTNFQVNLEQEQFQ